MFELDSDADEIGELTFNVDAPFNEEDFEPMGKAELKRLRFLSGINEG